MNNGFEAVIFDLDGTLLNTLDDLANAGNKTLACLHLPVHKLEDYRKMVGNGIEKLVERMLPEQNRGKSTLELALTLFKNNYEKHMDDFTRPYEGILPLLAALKEHNIKMAVLSNKAHEFAVPIINKHFSDIFDISLGLKEEFAPKPNPASTFYIMEHLKVNPQKVLYCGDSDVDMQTAKNAGICACGVLWGFRDKPELLGAGANYTAENAAELEQIILN